MKRWILVLLAAAALIAIAPVAGAHDRVAFAVTYNDGYYYPPPAYVAPAPVYYYPYGPRVIHPRHVCAPGYHFVPRHYSYRWHRVYGGYCRRW
jgi:hypothetical protein